MAEGTVKPDLLGFAFALAADYTLATRVLNVEAATVLENSLIGILPLTQAFYIVLYITTGAFKGYRIKGHVPEKEIKNDC